MNYTIDNIQVQHFRGIRHLRLRVEGRNLIIVGENGSGKSSLVDAIEYFLTGRIQPLEGRSDVDKRQSIPNSQGGSAVVGLSLRGVSPEGDIALPYPRREAAIPASLEPICNLATRRAFVLRRSQILGFINARGAERYEKISQLIGLGALDRIDDLWRQERNAAQSRVDELRRERQGVLSRLGELLYTEIRSEEDIFHPVNTQLTNLGLQPIAAHEDLARRKETLSQRMRFRLDIPKAEQLQALLNGVEQVDRAIAAISSQYEQLGSSMQGFWAQSEILEDAYIESLLTEGYRILLERPELLGCPLCKEPFRDKPALLMDLSDRVQRLQGLAESRKRVGVLRAELQNSLGLLGHSLYSLQSGLEGHGIGSWPGVIQKAEAEIDHQHSQLDGLDGRSRADRQWQVNRAIGDLQSTLSEISESITERLRMLAPTEAERTWFDGLVILTQVDEQWQMLHRKQDELHRARYVSQQISVVYNELIAARKRGLDCLLQELESDLVRLFQQLHPGEGYESISIPVQQDQRSSVALRARAHALEAHPLGHFSEGHLDSLGLCIFLAFIKRFSQDLRLIVMDDVLTTVDAGHRLRVARLLAREFDEYQLLITTHDQLWAKELASILPRSKLVPLKRWTLEQGVDYQDNVLSDWDYYAQQAQAGRPQDTIGGAGRNLEKFLYQMRANLGLAIPAKPDGVYTIGDLYGPFWNWVNKYQPARSDRPEFAQELKNLNRELDEVWRLRNWSGAHFNPWAETVTPDEALDFLHAIERLVTSFECPACQNLVVYSGTTGALICPRCQPCPPPQAICEYKPGWHGVSTKLLQATRPMVRQQAAGMARSVCLAFLRDLRRRLNFPVLATPNDEYGMTELYGPFLDWAKTHPLKDATDWPGMIKQHKEALDAYWQHGRWMDVPDAEIESFVTAVRQLTVLFECGACSQLLGYDHDQGIYFCAVCNRQEEIPSRVPAYWFVRKD